MSCGSPRSHHATESGLNENLRFFSHSFFLLLMTTTTPLPFPTATIFFYVSPFISPTTFLLFSHYFFTDVASLRHPEKVKANRLPLEEVHLHHSRALLSLRCACVSSIIFYHVANYFQFSNYFARNE